MPCTRSTGTVYHEGEPPDSEDRLFPSGRRPALRGHYSRLPTEKRFQRDQEDIPTKFGLENMARQHDSLRSESLGPVTRPTIAL